MEGGEGLFILACAAEKRHRLIIREIGVSERNQAVERADSIKAAVAALSGIPKRLTRLSATTARRGVRACH